MKNSFSITKGYQPWDVFQYGGNSYIARADTIGIAIGVMGGSISGATQATEIVVTSNLHELYNGARIKITGVVGMTAN